MSSIIKRIFREKAISQLVKLPQVAYVQLSEISSAIILFAVDSGSAENLKELESVESLLKKRGINSTAFVVIKGKSGNENSDMASVGRVAVTNKMVNWFGLPSQSVISELKSKKYDILLSFNGGDDFTLDYLAGSADARFKVGAEESSFCGYNLILRNENGGRLPVAGFMSELFTFLANFSTKKR